MRFGYCRVSSDVQHNDGQRSRLEAESCEEIYEDVMTGTARSRPDWDRLFARLRKGDELVVVRLDRLGRSLANLVDVLAELGERGVRLRILDLGIDTGTNHGRLIYNIMAALADWERSLIAERTREGLAAARERHGGKLPGRGRSLTDDQIKLARDLYSQRDTNKMTAKRIADLVGCSRQYLYEIVKEDA